MHKSTSPRTNPIAPCFFREAIFFFLDLFVERPSVERPSPCPTDYHFYPSPQQYLTLSSTLGNQYDCISDARYANSRTFMLALCPVTLKVSPPHTHLTIISLFECSARMVVRYSSFVPRQSVQLTPSQVRIYIR
jgi:hypothetical protein